MENKPEQKKFDKFKWTGHSHEQSQQQQSNWMMFHRIVPPKMLV